MDYCETKILYKAVIQSLLLKSGQKKLPTCDERMGEKASGFL